MPVVAKLNYLRIAPRKVRLVADLIRKKKVEEAQTVLNFTVKKAAKPLLKLLNSAVANATNNFQLDSSNLCVSKITVNEGPKYKRWMPRARGQASQIQKKTSHITLVLDEIKEAPKRKGMKKVEKRPVVPFGASGISKEQKKEVKEEKKTPEPEKPKPRAKLEKPKPKAPRGLKRIFRRKAF